MPPAGRTSSKGCRLRLFEVEPQGALVLRPTSPEVQVQAHGEDPILVVLEPVEMAAVTRPGRIEPEVRLEPEEPEGELSVQASAAEAP